MCNDKHAAMKHIFKYFILFPGLFLPLSFAAAQAAVSQVELRTVFIPEAVIINDKHTLYYELYVINPVADSVMLTTLDVYDVANNRKLLSISSTALAGRIHKTGKEPGSIPTTLQKGDTAIAYLEISSDKLAGRHLSHRLQYTSHSGKKTMALRLSGGAFTVPATIAAPLGSPLRAGPWVAIYEPSWGRGHRRVRYEIDRQARIPGRFAIDFMLLDSLGHFVKGDQEKIENWLGYGADVLAVAQGEVVGMQHDFPESPTLAGHPDYPPEKATGNYICLRVGEHRYVFYEHLKPGTITVAIGQKVKKGQTIAKLGFTGQTTGPHLHLHVADSPSPLGAEGLPFAFEQFKQTGSYPDFSTFGNRPWEANKNAAKDRTNERPAPNTVIEFPSP